MTKDNYLTMVQALFTQGAADAITEKPRAVPKYPASSGAYLADFAGAYYMGFDTYKDQATTLPFTLARAGTGFDDGAAKRPVDLFISITQKVMLNVPVVVWTDLTMLYKDAYAAGEKSVGTSCPTPTECPTCPTPGSPAACPEESHVGFWIAALGVAGLAFGVGYAISKSDKPFLRPAKANPGSLQRGRR